MTKLTSDTLCAVCRAPYYLWRGYSSSTVLASKKNGYATYYELCSEACNGVFQANPLPYEENYGYDLIGCLEYMD